MRRADVVVGGVALALLALGLLVQPGVLRFAPEQRVASAYFPRASVDDPEAGVSAGERTLAFLLSPPPPDPWGRPWVYRPFDPTVMSDAGAVRIRLDPVSRALLPGGAAKLAYSVGPDGKDDGGASGDDVRIEVEAVRRLIVTDAAAEAGGWLAGLVLLAWVVGRAGGRRTGLLAGLLPLVLGAMVAVTRTLGHLEFTGKVPTALPGPPMIVSVQGAAILSLVAVLGLVVGLGWTTTRAQVAGEGAAGA